MALGVDDVAAALGVSRNTVYKLLQRDLPYFTIGVRRLVPVTAVETYIQERLEIQRRRDAVRYRPSAPSPRNARRGAKPPSRR